MKLLAIETSSKRFSLATAEDEKILKTRDLVLDKVLSDSIIPSIQKILKDSHWTLDEIDVLIVGLGPGSFTSLRVGLSTVKGLAFAANKPVIGIPSLDAVAFAAGKTDSQICVISDAKRNMVYAAIYAKKAGTLKRTGEFLLTPILNLLDKIKTPTIFAGDGLEIYRKDIEKYFSLKADAQEISFASDKVMFPEAKYLIPLAQKDIEQKRFANIDKLVPLYLYPEDCQVQK